MTIPNKLFFLKKESADDGSYVWRLPKLPKLWVNATEWTDQTPMRFVFELNASEPKKSRIITEWMGNDR